MRARAEAVVSTLSLVLLCWRPVGGVCESGEATVGLLYTCELTRNDFFSTNGSEVEYSAALAGHPGLPQWLTALQLDSTTPGYLYGTPGDGDEGGTVLEVTAMDMTSFATERKDVEITVLPLNGDILLTMEFYLTNYDTQEFLSPTVLQQFMDVLLQVLGSVPGTNPRITHLIDPSNRNIPVSPPPTKHGVIVETTPGVNLRNYATASAQEARAVQGDCSTSDQLSLPPATFGLFADSGFAIDWCQFQINLMDEGESETEDSVGTAGDDSFASRPSSKDGSLVPLVAIMAGCVAVLLVVVTLLACIFFGGRKQALYIPRKKRVQKAAVMKHLQETSSGPKTAQRYLRDLSNLPRRRPAAPDSGDEGLVLVNGGVTGGEDAAQLQHIGQLPGFERHAPEHRPRDPPPYTYPQDLTRQTLGTHFSSSHLGPDSYA